MNNSFKCPFCGITMPITKDTHITRYPSFYHETGRFYNTNGRYTSPDCIAIDFYKCPSCESHSVIATKIGECYSDNSITFINPNSFAEVIPNYVPLAIREDYREAYSIINLSPKASATLARRCLQGIIRNFWNINESNLAKAINQLQDKVSLSQWKAIDSIRSIGNIGAHMEKDVNTIIDVEPDEAQKLLKLIELLIDKWYIARHDEEQLLTDISNIAKDKKSLKSK